MVQYSILIYDKSKKSYMYVKMLAKFKSLSEARKEAFTWMLVKDSTKALIEGRSGTGGVIEKHHYPLMLWVEYRDMKVYYANARTGERGSPVDGKLEYEVLSGTYRA